MANTYMQNICTSTHEKSITLNNTSLFLSPVLYVHIFCDSNPAKNGSKIYSSSVLASLTMKLAFISIVAGVLISNFATAWDEDSRCTGRRELEGVHFDLNEQEGLLNTKVSGANLRGPADGTLEVDALYASDV